MAYAAVISLTHTIERLQNLINPQITTSAYVELDSLRFTLKRLDDRSSRSIDRSVIYELDTKIREAVWKLEDVLESCFLYPPSQGVDEEGVEHEIDSFLKTAKMLSKEYIRELEKPLPDEGDGATVSPIQDDVGGNKSLTVGLSDLSEKIRNELLDGMTKLKTVSLVGMAGIGKTHLAREIYHHPLIVQHFDCRAWVSIGPKDQINNISSDILAQIDKEQSMLTLRDPLRNSLHGRRYLIVLDDMWTKVVFDYFPMLLPSDGNGSRVLLTTRLQEVVDNGRAEIQWMPFLNNEESWNLLWKNVFADESNFPYELEKAGRKIAEHCEGLPLLILAIANILRGHDKTEEYWKKVAQKKTNTFIVAYNQIYNVLLPSYEYLPQHLKACFLYMGVFPQSCVIPISKLINLWAVEDFLEPSWHQKSDQPMEDLVSKSLAIVCKESFDRIRRIKSSKLHSAFWHLCVTEARKNKFFHVLIRLTDVSKDYIESQRRLSVQNNILFGIKNVYDSMAAARSSTTRSLLFTGEDHQYPVRICFNMMLLKILDALAIRFYEFPEEVVRLLQIRYLSLTHNGELPSSISKLQQLQCLILRRHHNIKLLQRDSAYLPEEIWDMQDLRHLQIMGSNLPDPRYNLELPNLSTLNVNANSCTEIVFRGTPRLKKLGIKIELLPDAVETIRCFEHIGLLNELESLKCVVVNPRLRSQVVAPPDHLSNLPCWRLKRLSLNGLGYSWKCMSAIASLPDLEMLKLRCFAFQGPLWETKAGQFETLELLLLEDIDLVHWKVEGGYCNRFRSLRHLIVRHCYKLKKIPWEIVDSPFLGMIEVDDCSPSVAASAQQIKEKTESSHLKVVINSSWNN